MDYLSPSSLSEVNLHLLLIQPYQEATRNLDFACNTNLATKVRLKHALVGLVLTVPLINTLALLILRAYHKTHSSPVPPLSSFNDQPFTFWPFDKPMPKLLTDGKHVNSIPLEELTDLFLNRLFDEQIGQQQDDEFTISLSSQGKLIVKYQDCVVELSEIIEQIDWSDLDPKWQGLRREELKKYLDHSLIFENLKSEPDSPFNNSHPFIWLYTSYGFYSCVNPLLRKGSLYSGLLSYASPQVNADWCQKKPDIINHIAKEIFFISLATAASLNELPEKYRAKDKVIRLAYIPKAILNDIKNEQVIVERAFMSASAPGGGFAGGGPCDDESYRVKFIITTKNGKHVSQFSKLPENEVLFRPFTKFKVLKYSGSEKSGFRVELEEI